ncbi:15786_t:CDS:2, partial [Gigaspora rosea]
MNIEECRRVRAIFVSMISKTIDQAKKLQSKGEKLNASILSTIRLGLSSIVNFSSEFFDDMCIWFDKEGNKQNLTEIEFVFK